jgi:hypothetical protein
MTAGPEEQSGEFYRQLFTKPIAGQILKIVAQR